MSAVLAGVWGALLLPPQLRAWDGLNAPPWAVDLDRAGPYQAVHGALESVGLTDDYAVFGAAIALSFVLLWWATGPVLAAVGVAGRIYGWVLLATAPVVIASYSLHDAEPPLRYV